MRPNVTGVKLKIKIQGNGQQIDKMRVAKRMLLLLHSDY